MIRISHCAPHLLRGYVNYWALAGLGWLLSVVVGFSLVYCYQHHPGPHLFGVGTRAFAPAKTSEKPWYLVLAVHPHCVCTEGTVTTVIDLLRRYPHQIEVRALVYVPMDAEPEWMDTAHVNRLRESDRVQVEQDDLGHQLAQLGLHTSGAVVLIDRDNIIRYSGGLTPSRNHVGPNTGLQAVCNLIEDRRPAATTAPAFGCTW